MERFGGIPVEKEQVKISGGFWKEERDVVEKTTIDAVYDRFKETGRFDALRCDWHEGMPNMPHIFWESDITKWIEGAAYFLAEKRDPVLEAKIDDVADKMEAYQDENGYLNVYFTAVEPDARFTRRTDHELYCAGHLIEGAIAYAKATGKRKLLDVAIRYADMIDRTFRIEHSAAFDTPGHEEIELALVKLYGYTGEERYKKLAEYFVDTRGTSTKDMCYEGSDQQYMQSHIPVREQRTADGHSVRALYLYSGMADVALLNREDALADACGELFNNIVEKRMYITGGVGSTYLGEAFTYDYDLPDYSAYAETCASIALAMFSRRMWLIDADGKYADCAERALYNTVMGGISLSGDSFYYENPLAADPRKNSFNDSRPEGLKAHMPILERAKVFGCSCCPPNVVRMVGAIGEYMYSVSGRTVYTQCYMNGEAEIPLEGLTVKLAQKTEYPFDGRITITAGTAGRYTVAVRIPGWCTSYTLKLNGTPVEGTPVKGYIDLERDWAEDDTIELVLAMEVAVVEANTLVADTAGRVAFMRGPLVFCAEGIDNDDLALRDIRIAQDPQPEAATADICGRRLPVISVKADIRKRFEGLYRLYRPERENITLRLIPYFAWANRGVTEMNTWFLAE